MYSVKLIKKTLSTRYFLNSLCSNIVEYKISSTKDKIKELDSYRYFQKKIKKSYVQKLLNKFIFNSHLNTFIHYTNVSLFSKEFSKLLQQTSNIKLYNYFIGNKMYKFIFFSQLFPIYYPNFFHFIFKVL